ncbi:YggT family protein [Candidatus Methylocalor cossyra]|uniref:YGGT family protein n=1 Tax=Candidatus Methylocalor cossyra TaxID=3108543 RepID=A0ABM9NF48_9GAMM
MSADFLIEPAVFLIDTLFSLYIFALLLRFLFQWVEADYYNPISQFLIKITHPPLRWLRRFVPAIGKVDSASLVLMLALQMLDGYLIFLLEGSALSPAGLAVWALAQLLGLLFNLYFFAILIRALLSWVSPGVYNPAASLLYSLTEPVLRACRRALPPVGGIDLSPLIPLIGIQLAKMLVLPPLQQLMALLS